MTRDSELVVVLVQYLLELPLLLFSLYTASCIVAQVVKKNAAFSTGFYALYLLQTAVDLGEYAWVR